MIRVSLTLLIFIYLFLLVGTILGQWFWHELGRRRRERQSLRHRLRCSMCACEFEDASEEVLPRCPRCGTLNERYKPGIL